MDDLEVPPFQETPHSIIIHVCWAWIPKMICQYPTMSSCESHQALDMDIVEEKVVWVGGVKLTTMIGDLSNIKQP